MPTGRFLHAATVVFDTILVCGGYVEGTAISNTCVEYQDGAWKVLSANLPEGVAGHTMFTLASMSTYLHDLNNVF
jgi:hypothetical protein